MKLTGTMNIENGQLQIGGVGVSQLREEYGTPLQIFDQAEFKKQAGIFMAYFKSNRFATHVVYASKAFLNLYIAGLASRMGLYIDAVSAGELEVILQAGYDPARIYFHGNNKLPEELDLAVSNGIGTIIVDNTHEFELIEQIAAKYNRPVHVLLRINPNIQASTHKYIQTGTSDSKFGMNMADAKTRDLIAAMSNSQWVDLAGFHCHIGSQVLNENFFFEEAEILIKFVKEMEEEFDLEVRELDFGGGFGVYYTAEDQPFDFQKFLSHYISKIEEFIDAYGLNHIDTLTIEPGRSLINDSGSTLYTVGSVKETLAGIPFVFVDGGMSDNIRPALYQAKYEAALANKMDQAEAGHYRVAGRLCESGDILVNDAELPEPEPGDLLIMPRTGAYCYSMASNYNHMGRPAIVFVEDGQTHLAVRRESYQDMMARDLPYQQNN